MLSRTVYRKKQHRQSEVTCLCCFLEIEIFDVATLFDSKLEAAPFMASSELSSAGSVVVSFSVGLSCSVTSASVLPWAVDYSSS
ncbi:hypothetical protein A1A1_18677 [Planococcus antarcticus DSM 14505]|nr:hypothetical protein A1A1_18677 [Planococcus antarcticus DSM 14505]